ncbi:TetR/AcrR family transcriptional regulator [Breoghania sp. L-A4]|uniref:TetR/AcrR family transcriptional regulator n=1 Tax=Breoghania sp. L-A4 TaxID=2304600 RepID=UPI000E358766|nr:TetR/AcrR family transcriptional regulator [Breoghania sp. L-A4]AXS42038.1 TetR/AcrR family transcriptional regulator [Breoghania sp. L-A4]
MTEDAGQPRKSIGARRNPASADAIRDAAEAILCEAGYAGFSIEAVARRARAGKPTIYRWWPSKAALLLEVYHRQKGDVFDPDSGSLEEDVFLFLRSLFRLWRETPAGNTFKSILAEAQTDTAAAEAVKAYRADRLVHTSRIIERARARGEVRDDVDPLLAADLIASFAWSHLLVDALADDIDLFRKAARHLCGSWAPQ